MGAADSDENPSVGRAAGWSLEGLAEFGIVGALWALAVAIWARARHRGHRARP